MLLFKSFKLGFKCEAVNDEKDSNNPLRLRYPKGYLNPKKTKESSYKIKDKNNPPDDFIFIESHDLIAGINAGVATPEKKEPKKKDQKSDDTANKEADVKEQQTQEQTKDDTSQKKEQETYDISDWGF